MTIIELLEETMNQVSAIQQECYFDVIALLREVPLSTVVYALKASLKEAKQECSTEKVVAYSNILLMLEG